MRKKGRSQKQGVRKMPMRRQIVENRKFTCLSWFLALGSWFSILDAIFAITNLNQVTTTQSSTTGFVIKLTVVAALGGFLFGYDTAVISGVVPFITTKFALSDKMVGYAVSSAIVGCIIGSLSAGPISDRLGRKRVLIFTAILFAISSIGAALAASVTGFVIFRVIGGMGIGAASMLSPLYISEAAPAKIRGILVSVYQLAIVIGILIIYGVNFGIAGLGSEAWKVETGWRYMIASGLIPSALFLFLLFIVPESPRWLIKNKRRPEAMDTLERLNGKPEAIAVANEIESTLNVEEGTVAELFKPGLRKAMIVGIFLALFSQITGINAIIYYADRIFAAAGFVGAYIFMVTPTTSKPRSRKRPAATAESTPPLIAATTRTGADAAAGDSIGMRVKG